MPAPWHLTRRQESATHCTQNITHHLPHAHFAVLLVAAAPHAGKPGLLSHCPSLLSFLHSFSFHAFFASHLALVPPHSSLLTILHCRPRRLPLGSYHQPVLSTTKHFLCRCRDRRTRQTTRRFHTTVLKDACDQHHHRRSRPLLADHPGKPSCLAQLPPRPLPLQRPCSRHAQQLS